MSENENTNILDGQYPRSWDAYVGQHAAKENLRTTVESALSREDVIPHIMISSPYAGIGKTALGLLVCRAAQREVVTVSGQMTMAKALEMFEDLEDGDIVFYDEFHQVATGGARNWSWLLNYLESGVILTPTGEEPCPKVTFLAMTTEKRTLPAPLLDRFKHVELEPYTDEEGAGIAAHLGEKLLAPTGLPALSPATAQAVALAGDNQPRRMRDLIFSLRDLATVGAIETGEGEYAMDKALEFAGLTPDGLTKEAVTYLTVFRERFGRQAAGEGVVKSALGYGRANKLEGVESILVKRGYLALTKGGRMLTGTGSRRAKALAAA